MRPRRSASPPVRPRARTNSSTACRTATTPISSAAARTYPAQKQRLCIARALLKQPKVLILDDSTSAVDTATDAKIRAAFAERIPGTTKIIIAQRISSVEGADRILVLDEGRINGFDTHENLLESNAIIRRSMNLRSRAAATSTSPRERRRAYNETKRNPAGGRWACCGA